MTITEMAKHLYDLLVEDSKGAFDTIVELDYNTVTYEDQGGILIINFDTLELITSWDLQNTFGCDDKSEIYQYTDEHTTEIKFSKTEFGRTHAKLIQHYDTLEELIEGMKEHSLFLYMDLSFIKED